MKYKIFGLALVILGAQSASAQALADYEALYDSCLEQADTMNNSVVAMCADKVSKRATQEIKRRYESIYSYLLSEDAEDASQFSISQKAWRKYRKTHCALAGSYIGSPMYDYCPMKLNAGRSELRELDQTE